MRLEPPPHSRAPPHSCVPHSCAALNAPFGSRVTLPLAIYERSRVAAQSDTTTPPSSPKQKLANKGVYSEREIGLQLLHEVFFQTCRPKGGLATRVSQHEWVSSGGWVEHVTARFGLGAGVPSVAGQIAQTRLDHLRGTPTARMQQWGFNAGGGLSGGDPGWGGRDKGERRAKGRK